MIHSTGGGTWSNQTLPDSSSLVIAGFSSGPNDAWALQQFGAIFHKTTGAWFLDSSQATTNDSMRSIWGTSAFNIYIGSGSGVLYHHLN